MIDRDVASRRDGVSLAVNRSAKSTLPPQSALVLQVLVSMEFGHHPTPCSPVESACRGEEIGELTILPKSSQLLEVQQADGSAERLLSPTIVAPMLGFGETLPLHH